MPAEEEVDPGKGWSAYQIHVLSELKAHSDWLKSLNRSMLDLSREVAGLKVKSGVWGALGGAIPVILLILFEMLRKG